MKHLFKNIISKSGKQNKIIAILIVAIIVVGVFIAFMVGNFANKEPDTTTNESTTESTTLNEIVIPNETEENETEETKVNESEVLVLQEPTQQTATNSAKPNNTGSNTVNRAEPVKPAQPSGSVQSNKNEIVDNGNDSVKEYSCGVKGHHCDGKETHDFIVSLENKGCPYCGSHSCKSFYTYDEWGNACYDPTKCESYSAKNDPCEYCQECGKKVGDGNRNTCIQFTVDFTCSDCGKKVSAWTCHSH